MIPYFEQPVWSAGPFTISGFGLCLVAALWLGRFLMTSRAAGLALDRGVAADFWRGAVVAGLMGSIAGGVALGEEGRWPLSSAGGLIGGLLGGAYALRPAGLARDKALAFVDAAAFVFPWPWALFRLGCFLAHDHLGPPSSLWIAVDFPAGPRLDLGLIECLFMFGLGWVYLALDRSPRAPGFYLVATLFVYGPLRLALAPLRAGSAAGDLVLAAGCLAGGWWVLRRPLCPRGSEGDSHQIRNRPQ